MREIVQSLTSERSIRYCNVNSPYGKKDATDSVLVLLVLCFGVGFFAVRAFYQFMCVFVFMSSVMFR